MQKTSIILTAYIQNQFQCHMTMAAIANVTRYTDPQEYELILMSDSEKFPVRDDYKVLKIDQYVKTEKMSYTQSMNAGVKRAKGELLVFLQNDVFVWEGWLKNLRWYFEQGLCDCVIPDQCPRDRKFVKESYNMDMLTGAKYGSRDAGLLMISKDAFKRTGGWNEQLTILAEKDFYDRMANNGVNQIDTCKVMISHIMAATNLDLLNKNPLKYDDMMKKDAAILNQ